MHYCPFRHFPHPVTQVGFVRLACLIHAANVHSEPGSNPSKYIRFVVPVNRETCSGPSLHARGRFEAAGLESIHENGSDLAFSTIIGIALLVARVDRSTRMTAHGCDSRSG